VRVLTMLTVELQLVARQPSLLLALVLGPFLILFIFGIGHLDSSPTLRTVLVLPPGLQLPRDPAYWRDRFGSSVAVVGVGEDEQSALNQVKANQVDLAVILPGDAAAAFAAGHAAQIKIYNDKIDPVDRSYIDYTGYVLATELNKQVIAAVAGRAQAEIKQRGPFVDLQKNLTSIQSSVQANDVGQARQQVASARSSLATIRADLAIVDQLASGTVGALPGGQAGTAQLASAHQAESQVTKLETDLDQLDTVLATDPRNASAQLTQVQGDLGTLDTLTQALVSVPPDVLAAPFVSKTMSLTGYQPNFVAYYSPGVLALLLQHLAITMAALSLVRERLQGTMELYQVAPVHSTGVLLGKFLSYGLIGLVVGAALTVLMTRILGVPLSGDPVLFGLTVVLLLFASLGIGLTFSLLSTSQENAVQFAMLLLLASVFFSGFFLPIDTLKLPATAVSAILPVTYAITALQDLMLRGTLRSFEPLYALGAMGVISAIASSRLLHLKLRRR
jgi:ABC-2 type transport system permease protein